MRKNDSRRIGDNTYTVTQLPTSRATEAAIRLGNIAGPAVRGLKDGGVAAFGKLLEDLKPSDLEYFTSLFRDLTIVQGSKGKPQPLDVIYEDHFAGDLGALFKWLAFCVELNFKSFFPEIAAFVSKHAAGSEPATEGTTSPST